MVLATLKRADAAPKILEAFRAGALLLQRHPHDEPAYRGFTDGTPCAIGLLLSDRVARQLDYSQNVESLVKEGLIAADDPEWFQAVQVAHDKSQWDAFEALLSTPEMRDQVNSGDAQNG